MEYECGLTGYQNKCTTEWGLLSFIHMQSQSNEHPLHNPSRTWPSLKTLQQCGLLYPITALQGPSLCRTQYHVSIKHLLHVMCTSLEAITYDYSFAWQSVKGFKMSMPEQLTEMLPKTNLWLSSSDLNHDVIIWSRSLCSLWVVILVLRQHSCLHFYWGWWDTFVQCVFFHWCNTISFHQWSQPFGNSLW